MIGPLWSSARRYLLWFIFILGLNCISLCFRVWYWMIMSSMQREIKFKPRIKLHQLISLQKPADNVQGIISLRRNVYQCRPFGCLIWSSRSPSSDSANDYTNIWAWDVHFGTPPNVVTYQQIWAGEENMSLAIPLLKYSAYAPVRPSTSKCILHTL